MGDVQLSSSRGLKGKVGRSFDELVILCLLDSECHGYELIRQLRARGLDVAEGTLYPRLRRLERDGLLRSRWETGPRRRRYYVITDQGRQIRHATLERWSRLWRSLETLPTAAQWRSKRSGDDAALDAERSALATERQEVEGLRSDLLSTVSHELRTPLTLIRTSVGLLLDSDPDAAMQQRLLRNIKQSADRMHLLVTDILDLVRLRSGRTELHMRYLDVGELAASAASLMRPLLDEKEQSLLLDVPSPAPQVMGDHRRLEQVLLNLLSNANKFAPVGARVDMRVYEGEQTVTISVADTGPGISPDAQTRLFEQFYTARTSSPSHNIGAGLGLPIAKGIVEAHGGRIWVESGVGVGSTFHVALPKEGPGKEETDEDSGGG